MANKKITDATTATSVAGTDKVFLNQGGDLKQVDLNSAVANSQAVQTLNSNLNNLSDYTKYTPLILKHTQLSEEILKQYNNNLFDLPTGIYLTDFTTTSFLPELWGRLEIYSNGSYKYLRFITKQHMYFKIEGKDIFRLF